MCHWTLLDGSSQCYGCDGHTVPTISFQQAGFCPVLVVDTIRFDNLAVADVAEATLPGLATQLAAHVCTAAPSARQGQCHVGGRHGLCKAH